jgi:NADPH2:quinone reductase
MKAWRVHQKGRPTEALEFVEIEPPTPGPGEIRIRTATTACNLNEVDGCYGRYKTVDPPLPYTLGMEAVGVVDATGPGLEQWRDRRVMLTGAGATGAHAERVVGQVDMAFECPPSLDDFEAAAFYFPFHVAALSLIERGRLARGEIALVHGGAGGVGSAAIQLAVAHGARVIATAGSPEKLERCRALGADVAIDYRGGGFAQAVLEATDERGVDVVCDLIGGEVTRESLRCLAYGGRLMLSGFSGGIEAEDESGLLPRPIIFANASVSGVLMAYGNPDLLKGTGINLVPRARALEIEAELERHLEAGRIRPIVGRRASCRDLPIELERMERRETMGRTILDWSDA